MANEIVWFDSTETGAPTLNNVPGALDSVIYACLVTGFNPQSGLAITVSAGVATVSKASHGYSDQRMVQIGGATPAGLNGRKLITVTGSGAFTFPAPGVADGEATGAITSTRAPLGWDRPLSSGNVSIYSRTDVTATGMSLRVNNSAANGATSLTARVRLVEGYSDLNTLTNPTPSAASLDGNGLYWPFLNSASAQRWVLIGDGRTFYFACESNSYPASSYPGLQGLYGFGDIEPFRSGDAYACVVSGSDSPHSASGDTLGYGASLGSAFSEGTSLPRGFSGIGGPVRAAPISYGGSSGPFGYSGPVYPSPVDNGLFVSPNVLLAEQSSPFNHPFRGRLRGLGHPVASMRGGQLHLQVLDSVIGSDRRWLFVSIGGSSAYGHVAFDITGPW